MRTYTCPEIRARFSELVAAFCKESALPVTDCEFQRAQSLKLPPHPGVELPALVVVKPDWLREFKTVLNFVLPRVNFFEDANIRWGDYYQVKYPTGIQFLEQLRAERPSDKTLHQECVKLLNDPDAQEVFRTFFLRIRPGFYDRGAELLLAALQTPASMLVTGLAGFAQIKRLHAAFEIPGTYQIILTRYGCASTFSADEIDHKGEAKVVLRVEREANDEDGRRYQGYILHEMVHIGLERNLVRPLNLHQHYELKERLVDLVCRDLIQIPNYAMQRIGDQRLDPFFQEFLAGQCSLEAAVREALPVRKRRK